MKKIISFLLIIVTFSAGCMYDTFADFVAWENKMEMSHEMMQHDCHHMENQDCEEEKMQCCGSVYDAAIMQSCEEEDIKTLSKPHNIFDIALAQTQSISDIKIHQLHSPPEINKTVYLKNTYTGLIWVIKNNC